MNKLETLLSHKEDIAPSGASRTVKNIRRAALLVLAATLILVGCPDSAGDNNGNNDGNDDDQRR